MKKKNKRKIILIFILTGIMLFGVVGYKFYRDFIYDKSPDKEISSIGLYGYTLTKGDTEVYKSTFKELEDVLNEDTVNYENYAKLISKLFIIDVFTLNNKLSSTDIGGLQFLHKDLKVNFQENMGATLYKYVESNINGDRKQELPEVSSVTINSIFESVYNYNNTEYKAYLVDASWEYEKDFNYQNSIKLTIIRDKDILYVVSGE